MKKKTFERKQQNFWEILFGVDFISLLLPLLPPRSSCRCSLCSSEFLLQLQQQLHLGVHQALLGLACFHLSHLPQETIEAVAQYVDDIPCCLGLPPGLQARQ